MKIKNTHIYIAFLTCLFFTALNFFSAQEPIRLQRIVDPVQIDGIPDEDTWNSQNSFKLTMWRHTFGVEPTEAIDIRFGYDEELIWVGAWDLGLLDMQTAEDGATPGYDPREGNNFFLV